MAREAGMIVMMVGVVMERGRKLSSMLAQKSSLVIRQAKFHFVLPLADLPTVQ